MNYLTESIIKLFASILCGCILGWERKSRNQVVGMRTLVLISVSSTLLSLISAHGAELGGDPTRIAAGVVSGIGFLGGGAIIRQGLNIKGLTSAAIIWTASALGLAIGTGLYIQSAIVLFGAVILLVVLEKIEEKVFPAARTKELRLVFEKDNVDLQKIHEVVEGEGFIIADLNQTRIIATNQIILQYSVKAPPKEDVSQLVNKIKCLGELSEFSLSD